MFSRRSRLMRLSCVVNDLLATAVSFLLAYGIRVWMGQTHWWGRHDIYPFSAYLPVFLAIVLIIPLLGYLLHAYLIGYLALTQTNPAETTSGIPEMT